jgi:hypothetical protein
MLPLALRIVGDVECAVVVDAGEAVAGGVADGGEVAHHEDAAVGLDRDAGDGAVGARVEAGVEGAVGGEADEVCCRWCR